MNTTTTADETIIWSGGPSQLKNLKIYILCFLFCWLIVPIFIAIWKWIELRCLQYELTTQRLKTRHGILNKHIDELELYRVKDTSLELPFWQRIFGLGTVMMDTSDRSTPQVKMEAIPDAQEVREMLRTHVESLRDKKRVREIDFE
jgi:uncharacterized membrane protein YdbT with pleckstrin-like domain